MIEKILLHTYISDIPMLLVGVFLMLVLWFIAMVFFAPKMRVVSAVVYVVTVIVILYATVMSRGSSVYEYYLMPFSLFERAVGDREVFRSALMNILLFLPLGLTLPYALGGGSKKSVVATLVVSFLLSVGCEVAQYVFSLGVAETDDVICNTIGTALGCCTCLLFISLTKLIKKERKDRTDD